MKSRLPEINMSAIRVGGNLGGLIFAAGAVAILLIGVPGLRWFIGLSLALATVLAAGTIAWRRTH
ncbi:MAG TPA: hypothetical protein VFO21_24170 [Vicinamibacterales bacterium]|nr:hypothetical protein [Vicinamibacterales bacterium]